MNKVLKNLKDVVNQYRFDQVNCYEHPLTIIYNYIMPGSENIYLMYRKLYESFSIDVDHNELKNFEEELAISCEKVLVDDNLVNKIRELINKGYPVIVPGNLKELYYSNHYKKDDWGHLFLVRGYNDDQKLFSLLDSLHLPDQNSLQNYVDFVIRYDDMLNIFNEYKGQDNKYIFYLTQKGTNKSTKVSLIQFLNMFYEQLKTRNYVEDEYIELFNKVTLNLEKEEVKSKVIEFKNIMLNVPKYKVVIIELLIKSMEKFSYEAYELKNLRNRLEGLWNIDNLLLIKKVLKRGKEKIKFMPSEETKSNEENLMEEILKCISFLHNLKDSADANKIKFLCENNTDNIIEYKDNGYTFNFNTGITYNTWLTDNCPKVIISDSYIDIGEFDFKVNCSVIKENPIVGHQEGMFIKTVTDDMYTFALDFNQEYVLDYVGKYTIEKFESKLIKSETVLWMKRKNKILSIGVVEKDNLYKELYVFDKDMEILQVGLFCKTWDNCKELKVHFSECEFTNKKRK